MDPTPTGLAASLSDALTNFGTVWTDMAGIITGNEVLMVFLAGGLLMLAFRVFKRGRKAVR